MQQTCTPLKARQWFKLRLWINFGIALAVFVPLFFVLMLFLDALVAGIIAVAAVLCLYFAFLDRRTIRIKCNKCRKYIDTNTPWKCGYKGCWNDNVDEYPFIYQCEHCDYIPKAYKCHHCGELIFLTTDRQKTCPAECVNVPEVVEKELKKRNFRGDQITEQVWEVNDLKHELDVTKLKKAIEIVKNKPAVPPTPPAPPVPKTREQIIMEAILEDVKFGRSLFDTERKLKEKANEEFATDPDGLEEMHRIIEGAIFKYKN